MLSKIFDNPWTIVVLLGLSYFAMSYGEAHSIVVLDILAIIGSIVVLVLSADNFTDVAVRVGRAIGLSGLATGSLIIALGTSAPEFFSSIGAAVQGQPDMVIGNMLGTIVANSLLGIGFGALFAFKALEVHRDVFGTQMSVLLAAIIILVAGLYDGVLHWYEGLSLCILLGFYLYNQGKSRDESNGDENGGENGGENGEGKPKLAILDVLMLVVYLSMLFFAGEFAVSALLNTANYFDFSSAKLATSVLAVGTSIPEIATSVVLVRKGKVDELFGNVIGSNIFGVLGIMGSISLFLPLAMSSYLLYYLLGSVVLMFIVTSSIMNDKEINRLEGIALISLFVAFTIQLVNI